MAAHQAPLSLGFSRQEHWSGLPFPSPMHESEKWKWSRSVVSTLSDPMDCSPPGSSIHGIFQARVLEWSAIAFSAHGHHHMVKLKSDWLYSLQSKMEKLYRVNNNKKISGADCVSDHELLIAKFRITLKKIWKTTRPFRYDLNQIPYDYTVDVTNRFKGLDLIDRVPEEL